MVLQSYSSKNSATIKNRNCYIDEYAFSIPHPYATLVP